MRENIENQLLLSQRENVCIIIIIHSCACAYCKIGWGWSCFQSRGQEMDGEF